MASSRISTSYPPNGRIGEKARVRQSCFDHPVTRRDSGQYHRNGDAPPPGSATGRDQGRSALEHLAEHVLQDAAVAVVVRLARGVDADVGVELDAGVGQDLHRRRDAAVVEGLD